MLFAWLPLRQNQAVRVHPESIAHTNVPRVTFLKIHTISWLPSKILMRFQALAEFNGSSLFSLRAPIMKKGEIRRLPATRDTNGGYAQPHIMFFNQLHFKQQ